MKQIHGTFNSFETMAAAMGFKTPKIKEKEHKCPDCGNPMDHIAGSNVFACPFSKLEERELNGKPVQVFSKCGGFVITE